MRYLLIFLILVVFASMLATNAAYAQCAPDPSNTRAPCYDNPGTLVIKLHEAEIENIDGQLFMVIGPFALEAESKDTIRLGNIEFSHPSYPVPPVPGGVMFVNILFQDGVKESIGRVGPPTPFVEFTDHQDPNAGIRRNADGAFDFLLGVDKQSLSPLKQFKSGVPVDEIECKEGLVLLQRHDGSPACVKPTSVIDLIKRNWMVIEDVSGYAIDYDGDVEHLPFADICSNEMKILLLAHSNIASIDEEFVMDDLKLPSGMNQEDFDRCAQETSFTKSRWNMVTMEDPEPSP